MSIPSEISNSNIFLDNSRMIHIVAEVLVVSGLTSYVIYQNKKLNKTISELTLRLEEKDEMYSKLEANVAQLNSVLSQMTQKLQQHDNGLNILSERISMLSEASGSNPFNGPSGVNVPSGPSGPSGKDLSEMFKKGKSVGKTVIKGKGVPAETVKKHVKPVLKETPPVSRVSKIQFKKPIVEDDSDDDKVVGKSKISDDLSDSDLDDEISQELAELEELDGEDFSLKKER